MTGDPRREAVLVLNGAARRLGAGESSSAGAAVRAVNGGPGAPQVWIHISDVLSAQGLNFRQLDALPRAEQQRVLQAAADALVRELQGRDRPEEAAAQPRFATGGPIVGRGPIVPIDDGCTYTIPASAAQAAGGMSALKALNDMTLDTCDVELDRLRDENAELQLRVQELTGERDQALAELAQFHGGVVVINDRLDEALGVES